MTTIRIIGPGRAGGSFAAALARVGVDVDLLARDAEVHDAAVGVDAVLIATPDRVIASVAAAIASGQAAVLHCSGATPLTALGGHTRVGSLHPLMALPDSDVGADRLLGGGWFAVAGDPVALELAERLGGRHFPVADDKRALYHATAAVSANHLVALLGQVERLAEQVGVPVGAFLELAQGSFDDVARRGAVAALTGPAARGDHSTLDAHRAALPIEERELYEALVVAAAALRNAT